MTKDYGEIICTAVDEIVRARINSLEFNVTKTCTIIDINSRKQGKYGVSDGSISFTALSQDTTYNLDDSVLVLIPNGDYKNDKLILSKINRETELPYNYTSPLNMMVTLTDNVLGSAKYGSDPKVETGALLANETWMPQEERELSGSNAGTSVVLYDFNQNLNQLNGFTRIGISVDFKSLLNTYDVRTGTYGIFLEIYSKQSEKGEEKECVTVLPFNCMEMVGNPYNFESYFTQEKVFDISYIQNIQRICVVFYQGDDFLNSGKNPIPHEYESFPDKKLEKLDANLFASNVKMYFGQGVNEFDKETLTLYTNDTPSYHYSKGDANGKSLIIRWVHKVDDNTYIPLSGGSGLDLTKYEVRWYRFNSATTVVDDYAGEGWERINDVPNNAFSMTFMPSIALLKEKIKVVGIVRDGTVTTYTSNVLELTNEEYVPDAAIFDISDGLSIGCLDDTAGNYFLYDQNGYLNNRGLGEKYLRSLAPLWKGNQINYDTFPGETVDYVEWWFPTKNSMLVCGEDAAKIEILNGLEYKVFKFVPNQIENKNWDKNDLVFDYSIRDYWAKNDSNNTIRCILSKNGVQYTTLKELQFGRAGSNGTNLTMVLEFMGGNNALVLDTSANMEEYSDRLKELDRSIIEARQVHADEIEAYEEELNRIKTEYGQSLLPYTNNLKYQAVMQEKYNRLARIQEDYLNGLYDNEIQYQIDINMAQCECEQMLIQEVEHKEYQTLMQMMRLELDKADTQYKYGEFESEAHYQQKISEIKAKYYPQLTCFTTQLQYQKVIQDLSQEMDRIERAYADANKEFEQEQQELIEKIMEANRLVLLQSSNYGLGVEARLYDSNGSRIDFTEEQVQNLSWSWFKVTPEKNYMKYTINQILNEDGSGTHSDSSVTITWDSIPTTMPQDNYYVLMAEYQADILATKITAFLPIPIKSLNCSHMEGAKEVVYNHQGTPNYYKDAYKAFEYIKSAESGNWIYRDLNADWTCNSPEEDESLRPHLSKIKVNEVMVENPKGGLVAPLFYIKGQSDQGCVSCAHWSQPLLIMQSHYDFAMLNEWDESLTIDEKNGTILSTMLGAGKKVDNKFSGVLIGDLVAGTDLLTAPRNTGVYGFSEGQMSFGFKDDGTAFIGKEGKGQILFDGNSGIIKSPLMQFDKNNKLTKDSYGVFIDLDDANLMIKGKSTGTTSQLDIISGSGVSLMSIGPTDYYLQSNNYPEKGFKLDLENGSIQAKDFKLQDTDGCNLIYLDEDTYYLQSHGFNDGEEDQSLAKGTQINLNDGSIVSYDFNLTTMTVKNKTYAGSYLSLNSGFDDETDYVGPSMSVVQNKNGTALALFDVSTDRFIMHSPNWGISQKKVQVVTETKIRYNSGWNFRSGPGTSYSAICMPQSNFYSPKLEVSSNGQWHKVIYNNMEGWIWHEAAHPEDTQPGETKTITQQTGTGLEFNVKEGKLLGYSGADDGNALLIDTSNNQWAIQVGNVSSDYNFKIGWDGSLSGGTSFDWDIDANGVATFNSLIANDGEIKSVDINGARIGYATVGRITLSGGTIKGSGWSLSNTTLSLGGEATTVANIYYFTPTNGTVGTKCPVYIDTDGSYYAAFPALSVSSRVVGVTFASS